MTTNLMENPAKVGVLLEISYTVQPVAIISLLLPKFKAAIKFDMPCPKSRHMYIYILCDHNY